jgi:hypothetical protein
MTEVTVFIRESDVLARFVKLQNYDVLVNPMVANGEMPHRRWNILLADIGFKSAKENLDVVQSLRYYMRVSNYCERCVFVIPDNNQDERAYVDKLFAFEKLVSKNSEVRSFARKYTWILPLHGTSLFIFYAMFCKKLRNMGINCIYGLPSLRATVSFYNLDLVESGRVKFELIDCSRKPEVCVYYNMVKYSEIIRMDKDARFHAMGCNMDLFATYVHNQFFSRVISIDTMSYRRAPDNSLKVNGRYMCTDSRQCWDWFNVWIKKAINKDPIKPKTNVLF